MRGIQNKKIIAGFWVLISRSFRLRDMVRSKAVKPHILMFHQVRATEADCKPGDFSVSIGRFEEILAWHAQHGYRFAGIDELTKNKRGGALFAI